MKKEVKRLTEILKDSYFWDKTIQNPGYQTLIEDILSIQNKEQRQRKFAFYGFILTLMPLVLLCFKSLVI